MLAHRGFDQNRLVQLRFPQLSFHLGGRLVDAAAAAGATQRRNDPSHRQLGSRSWRGGDRQRGAGFGAGDPQPAAST